VVAVSFGLVWSVLAILGFECDRQAFSYLMNKVSCFFPRLASDYNAPTYVSHIARIQACTTLPSLFVGMGLH
jgi:hypothetical protein